MPCPGSCTSETALSSAGNFVPSVDNVPNSRPGKRGWFCCGPCRTRRKGEGKKCVVEGQDLLEACPPCKKRGFSAAECGRKDWPKTSKRRRLDSNLTVTTATVEESPLVTKVLGLEADMTKMKERIADLIAPCPRLEQLLGHHHLEPEGIHSTSDNASRLPVPHRSVPFQSIMDGQLPANISTLPDIGLDFTDILTRSLSPAFSVAGHSSLSSEEFIQPPTANANSTQSDGKNVTEVFELVSRCTNADMALPIMEYLKRHAVWTNGKIRDVAGFLIHAMNTFAGDDPLPLLKWREGEDTDVMAIFKVDKLTGLCSCLMHYGVERCWEPNGKRWKSSSMAWVAKDTTDMRELFIAAQHVWGLLRESNAEILRLYANTGTANRSMNELSRCAQLLVRHVSTINEMTNAFDEVTSVIEKFSSIVELNGRDGILHRFLRASLDL